MLDSTEKVMGLIFGHEDYLSSIGAKNRDDQANLQYARMHIINHAKARKLFAIDSPFLQIDRPDLCYSYAQESSSLGFDGMLVLHPSQIDPANDGYSPSSDEIKTAISIIENVSNKNDYAIEFSDGKFIAPPVVLQSREIINKAKNFGLL